MTHIIVFALSTTLAFVVVGVVAGMTGLFSARLVVPAGLLVTYGLSRLWRRMPYIDRSAASGLWWAAVAIAVTAVMLNGVHPSEQYIGGRDGATYLATGAWLADDGGLLVDAREGPFENVEGLEFGGFGFFDSRDDGRLRPQFLHGLPALLATGKAVGGDWLMLRINPLLGGLALLAVFAFATLLVGEPLALLVEAALAANLVFAFYARAPFSEILAVLFIFGGLWALWKAWEFRSEKIAVFAGLVFGGSLLARIDSLVLLIPLALYLAYAQRRDDGSDRGIARWFWRGLLPMLTLAFADLVFVAPDYLANLRGQVIAILAVLALVLVGDAVAGSRVAEVARSVPSRLWDNVSWLGAGAVLAFGVFAYFVRPVVQEVGGSPYVQLAMDPTELVAGSDRLFSEQSARWLGWYLGPPTVLIAFAGWAWLTKRLVAGGKRRAVPFVLIFSSVTVLYLWRPSINPDHIWAMRRYLPVVIPGLLIVGAFLIRELYEVASRMTRHRVLAAAAAALLATGMLLGSLAVFMPLADLQQFDGLGADLRSGCDIMGERAAVLIVDTPDSAVGPRLASTYRSHCGLPTAYTDDADPKLLADLQRAWAEEGRELWLLSVDRERLGRLGQGAVHGVLIGDYDILELTFTHRPDEVGDFVVAVYGTRAPLP